jgi:hypothetical protein
VAVPKLDRSSDQLHLAHTTIEHDSEKAG